MEISGPVLAHTFEYAGTRYYLFGDRHFSKQQACAKPGTWLTADKEYRDYHPSRFRIDAWLHRLFSRGRVTDFFLEESYFNTRGPGPNNDYLGLLQHQFAEELEKRSTRYPEVRFHYLDIRIIEKHNVVLELWLYHQGSKLPKYLDFYRQTGFSLFKAYLCSHDFPQTVKRLIRQSSLSPKDQNSCLRCLLHPRMICGSISRIRKQLLAIPRHLRHRVIRFLLERYNREERSDILAQCIENSALYMDAYALARMLRPFSPRSEYKVVYAGKAHIDLYAEFFTRQRINLVSSRSHSLRCQYLTVDE